MNYLGQFCKFLSPPKAFDANTERHFLCDYSERHHSCRRVASVVGLCICLAYFGLDIIDAFADPHFKVIFESVIFPLRLSGTIALAVATWLTFHPRLKNNEHYANFCGLLCILSTYMMLLALTIACPYPGHYLFYYDGMLLVILYLCGLSKMLAKPTFILLGLMLLLSLLTFMSDAGTISLANLDARNDVDHDSPMSFLAIFTLVGYLISLEQERAARYTFLHEHDLQQAHDTIKKSAEAIISLQVNARLQAQQQSHDKSNFIANAAHDLRNVMQPIGIFLNLSHNALLRRNQPQAQSYINEAISANQALRSDINAILDISELDFGIIHLHYSSFDVQALAAEVLTENRLSAKAHNVLLHLSKNRALQPVVKSDRHQLKRILSNLVSNAIKYADPDKAEASTVVIAIISHAKNVRLDVIDNGIGIREDEQENVFKPLYQLNNANRDRENGKGLGLSIVKSSLNLLHQHRLKLASKPGIGTRFSLILPKGDSATPLKSAQLADDECSLSGLYVLLVENDPLVRQSLIALLEDQGAHYEAVSSMDGLRLLLPSLERDPDVVVTDYRLQDSHSAKDVIQTLNAHFGYELPILILTAETIDLDPSLAGLSIMHKPAEAKRLLMEINRLAQKNGLPA
jgi:signal transduction histidine kinase/CheY-like chemotaxis protein